MSEESIIDYIHKHYPKIIFNQIGNIVKDSKVLTFIIKDDLILGLIDKTGHLVRLNSNVKFSDIQKDLVETEGVSKILNVSDDMVNRLKKASRNINLDELKELLKMSDNSYRVYEENGKLLMIKKEYEDIIQNIKKEVENIKNKAKEDLVKYKENFDQYKKEYEQNIKDCVSRADYNSIRELNKKLNSDKIEMEERLNSTNLLNNELKETMQKYKNDLEKFQNNYNLKETLGAACIKQISEDKDLLINKIREYNKNWKEYAKSKKFKIDLVQQNIINDLDLVMNGINDIIKNKDSYIKKLRAITGEKDIEIQKLKYNIENIKEELQNTASNQLLELKIKNEELLLEIENYKKLFIINQNEIKVLKEELDRIKTLLEKDSKERIVEIVDYENCNFLLQRFKTINNMFYRKQEIIKILDNIIGKKLDIFNNLSENQKETIISDYTFVKNEMQKQIKFLDLSKYTEGSYVKYFNSKSTYSNIPAEFCKKLVELSVYWDENKDLFASHERILTNIYEDLGGAVRIFVKIKPMLDLDPQESCIKKDNRKVSVTCKGVKHDFGEFYDVFDQDFSNKDVFAGTNVAEKGLKVPDDSKGIYSSFKQLEDGYSIILFGYGASGSGKTRTLLGEKNVPGIIHYGLSNLNGVEKISIEYVFEQYLKRYTPTINKIMGNIHNLVGKVPHLSKYSVDETREFMNGRDFTNIDINDISKIVDSITDYRISKGRIRATPNNPVSSRSNLFIVFRVDFKDGNHGYATIVDMGGRENPIEIYNMFIQPSGGGSTMTTILGPTGGPDIVNKYIKDDIRGKYSPENIYEILKEGIYINECLNHIIYFFDKKNYKPIDIKIQKSLETYGLDKSYVNPQNEENFIDPVNNCLSVPILKFLDGLSKSSTKKDYKPSKFIMIAAVRQEVKYCDQIYQSLKFANRIRSN